MDIFAAFFPLLHFTYLAALLEFFESEFVVVVLVHLIEDLLYPFLRSVLVLAACRLLSLREYIHVNTI